MKRNISNCAREVRRTPLVTSIIPLELVEFPVDVLDRSFHARDGNVLQSVHTTVRHLSRRWRDWLGAVTVTAILQHGRASFSKQNTTTCLDFPGFSRRGCILITCGVVIRVRQQRQRSYVKRGKFNSLPHRIEARYGDLTYYAKKAWLVFQFVHTCTRGYSGLTKRLC